MSVWVCTVYEMAAGRHVLWRIGGYAANSCDIPVCGKIYTILQGALYTPVRTLYRFRDPGSYDCAGAQTDVWNRAGR